MQKNGIIKGAVILTAANLITRVLGFVYRIYMSKAIGAEGMGLFQLIMPVYMLVWSISSSGFSTTVSKLTAQENAKKNSANIHRILTLSVITSVLIAFILSILMFLFADYIALRILKDTRCILSLRLLSPCFVFMAAGSCIRGYFFGLQETAVPAVSQVLEQLTRMAFVYFLAGFFIPKGITYACAVAVGGMCIGELFSFIYVLLCLKLSKHKRTRAKKAALSPFKAYILILSMAVPLTLNRVTGSFLSTLENILIPQRLIAFGMTSASAISLYGRLSGMAMPLLMFPSSLLTAIATALVPAVSEAQAVKNKKRIKSAVSKALLLTFVMGIGSTGIFLALPNELGTIIYSDPEIGPLLRGLSIICPFLYLQVTLSGVLNGLGEQLFIFRTNLLSSAVNISFIYFLIPKYGIYAFIAGWFSACLITSAASLLKIKAKTGIRFDFSALILKPAVCIAAAYTLYKTAFSRLTSIPQAAAVCIALLIIGSFYCIFLILCGCLTKEDFKDIINNL